MVTISLKAARVNAELSQDEVAQKIGRSKQTVINWETGTTEIKYRDLLVLSELYGIPIENLRLPEKKGKKEQG